MTVDESSTAAEISSQSQPDVRPRHRELGEHRCVVLVHGIGTEPRGSFLTDVAEPLTALIKNAYGPDCRVDIDTNLSPALDTGASSVTRFQTRPASADSRDLVLYFREAWWAQRFLRPTAGDVLYWTLREFRAQAASIRRGIRIGMSGKAELQARAAEPAQLSNDHEVYASPGRTATSWLYDAIMGSLLWVIFVLGYPFVALLILLAWALQGVLAILGSNSAAQFAQHLLRAVFVDRLSEVFLYLTTEQIRASIRGSVQDTIAAALAPDHGNCLGLTIIAHSWGAVVVLDSLLEIGKLRDQATLPPVTFVGVGAAFNRAWEMEPKDPLWQDLGKIRTWLERIRWVNIWARYDPFSSGPLDRTLREHLQSAGATVYERRVVNLDDPLADHTSYWTNAPEVLSRLAYETLGRATPEPIRRLASSDTQAIRRRAVGQFAILRTIFYVAAGVVATMYWWGTHRTDLWVALSLLSFALEACMISLWLPRAWFSFLAALSAAIPAAAGFVLRSFASTRLPWLVDRWNWALSEKHWQLTLLGGALALILLIFKIVERTVFLPRLQDPLLDADHFNGQA